MMMAGSRTCKKKKKKRSVSVGQFGRPITEMNGAGRAGKEGTEIKKK